MKFMVTLSWLKVLNLQNNNTYGDSTKIKIEDFTISFRQKIFASFQEKMFKMEAKENKNDISSLFLIKIFTLYVVILIGFANKSKLFDNFSDNSAKNVATIQSGKHNFKKINTDQTTFFK